MKQKDISFPDCWEEMKPLEWLHLLKIRSQLIKQPGVALIDVKREWCAYVLKNRGYRFKSKVDDMLLVDRLAGTLGWMWKVEEGVVERFIKQDPADLRALCAILYRRTLKDKGCILREPFRPQYMGRYMEAVRYMPDWMQWGVYAWFAYFCHYLFTGTFIIDGLELCFAPVFDRHRKSPAAQPGIIQNLGMNSVLYSVAESGIFGNVDATDDTLLLRVMMKLLDDKQRADEMMRNLKK